MICHVPDPPSISDVAFIPASPPEIADGFLGWVTCIVDGTLRLAPMRVRLLHCGALRIKVPRGGIDLHAGSMSIDDEERLDVHDLIEAAPEFRAGLEAIGIVRGGAAEAGLEAGP